MTRLLTTVSAAVLLLVGAAHAQQSPPPNATAPVNPAMSGTAMAGKPMAHSRGMRHSTRAHKATAARGGKRMAATAGRGVPRERGSDAVDALNDQSLARARGNQ